MLPERPLAHINQKLTETGGLLELVAPGNALQKRAAFLRGAGA
jgi:hypothetical protein